MSKVYVLVDRIPYEGDEVKGVTTKWDTAKEWVAKDAEYRAYEVFKLNDIPPEPTPPPKVEGPMTAQDAAINEMYHREMVRYLNRSSIFYGIADKQGDIVVPDKIDKLAEGDKTEVLRKYIINTDVE